MPGFNRPMNPGQVSVALAGSPQLLGTIVATTSKDNSNTAVPFTIPAGAVLLLQPDAKCYVRATTAAATAATAANAVTLAANERWTIILSGETNALPELWIACLSDAGTTNLKVFQLA